MLFKWANQIIFSLTHLTHLLVSSNLQIAEVYRWKHVTHGKSFALWKLITQIRFQPECTDEYCQSPRFQWKVSRSGFKHGIFTIRDSALPMSYPDYIHTINRLFDIIRSASFGSLPMKHVTHGNSFALRKLIIQIRFQPESTDEYSQAPRFQFWPRYFSLFFGNLFNFDLHLQRN